MAGMDDLETRVAALETIVASLRARQNDHRGELVRVADAVADVRVVQAEHSEALAVITAELAAHTGALEVLTEIQRDQGRLLASHGEMLAEILRRLPD